MTGIPRKIVAFTRWLFASEQLLLTPVEDADAVPRAQHFLRWVFSGDELARGKPRKPQEARAESFLQLVLAPERLTDARDDTGGEVKPAVSFWRWVLAREELPELRPRGVLDERWPMLLRWVLSPEVCPTSAEPTCRRKEGLLHRLLSPEPCPTGEPMTHHRNAGFLRWALSSEVCPTGTASTPRRRRGFLRWLMSPERLTP